MGAQERDEIDEVLERLTDCVAHGDYEGAALAHIDLADEIVSIESQAVVTALEAVTYALLHLASEMKQP